MKYLIPTLLRGSIPPSDCAKELEKSMDWYWKKSSSKK